MHPAAHTIGPACERQPPVRDPAGATAAHVPMHPDAHTIGTACERRLAAIRQIPPFPPRSPTFVRVAFTGGSRVPVAKWTGVATWAT